MAWGLDRVALEAGRDEMLEEVARRSVHRVLEQLARAHRWLDEEDDARRRFREAAADLDERIEQRGRGDADSRGRAGGLLRLAGDEDAARGWFQRALNDLDAASPSDAGQVAALRYLLGEDPGAQEAAARAEEPYPLLEAIIGLARARENRDPNRAAEAREVLARVIHANRTPPFDESGQPDLSLFDWFEEAVRVEAELRGEPMPRHDEMLVRAGLATAATSAQDSTSPAPGRHAITSTTPDGAKVESTVAVGTDGTVDMALDPREGIGLSLRMFDDFGELRVRIEWGDDEEGWFEQDLPDNHPGFAAAVDAAADWLRAHAPDPPGGEWAAETVRALAAVL